MNGTAFKNPCKKPWLDDYPSGVDREIDAGRFASVAALFDDAVVRFRDRVAFHQMGVDLTYGQFDLQSRRLAAFFQEDLGLAPGDRIALMMPNVIQYPIALYAALRAGLVVVNINPLYTAPELVHLVTDAKPRAIVVLETSAATVERALTSVRIEAVVVASVSDPQSFPRSLIVDYVVRRRKKLVPAWTIPGAIAFRSALSRRPATAFRPPVLSHDTLAFLQYTGGTTSAPKGAILTHGNVVAEVLMLEAFYRPLVQAGRETFLIAMPLYHVAGLMCQCFNAFRIGARSVLVINARDIPSLVKDFAAHKPTVFIAINTLFAALMNNEAFRKLDFSALRLVAAGGAATTGAVAEQWRKLTGHVIHEAYGLSEVTGAVSGSPVGRDRFDGSIGVPFPSTVIEIRDEQRLEVPFGTPGEICVKAPTVMKGYYNRPRETAAAIGADGFFATGDIGVMDARGIITIIDRKNDMILVSGFNVYPNEIEEALAHHAGVREVGVVGVPDAKCGEVPVACVVRTEAAVTEEDLLAFARGSLAAYKTPRRIVFVESIPKTPVGKILRRELRALVS